jgi:acetolactate synthase regulatory subunit
VSTVTVAQKLDMQFTVKTDVSTVTVAKKMDKQQSSERVVNFVKRRTFCIPKIERRIEKVK